MTPLNRTSLRALTAAAMLIAAWNASADETRKPLPACNLTAFASSQPFDMRQFRGKVLYVDFWASWCASCVKSFPFLETLHKEFGERGLQIIGINLDDDVDSAKAFLSKRPASFPLAADETGQCPREFGVVGMPSSFLVDRDGTIRHVLVGFRPGEAGNIRKLIESLLAENSGSTDRVGQVQ